MSGEYPAPVLETKDDRIATLRMAVIGLSNFLDSRMPFDQEARMMVISARAILDRDEMGGAA